MERMCIKKKIIIHSFILNIFHPLTLPWRQDGNVYKSVSVYLTCIFMYVCMYVCFHWKTWYLFLGQRHGRDWWLVLLSDRRWAVNVSSSKGYPNESRMLSYSSFTLKTCSCSRVISWFCPLALGRWITFRTRPESENTHKIHTVFKLTKWTSHNFPQKFSKPTVYVSIHHKHTPVPMNSTSYCPSTASTLSTRRRVSL